MVNDLRTIGNNTETEDCKSPLKRSASTTSFESSIEDQTPVKRFKRENNFDLSYVGSPREMRRLRADLLEARNTIIDLENRIKHMHNVRKEMQLMFDNETQSLKRQHDYDRKSIEELETQLQTIRKRETDLKKELAEAKDNFNTVKTSNDTKISVLESEVATLKDKSQTAELEDSVESSALKRTILELQTVLQAAQEDAEAQKKLASELAKELSEKNTLLIDMELKEVAFQKAKNQLRLLESAKEDYLEFQEQAKSQAHKLARYIELERENERLKEDFARMKGDIKNKIFLEEEVHDLRSRLTKHKELEKKVADLQVQDSQNQMYLNEWRAVARGFCETTESDSVLPHLLRSSIEKLQQQEISLTAEKVEFESQLKSAQHAAKVAKSELEKNQKLLNDLKVTGDQKQLLIHRMQKKLLLVSRERDSYRLQLDSYEKDLTIVDSGTNEAAGSKVIQSQRERIDNLEKIVDGYRDLVAKLENDLQTAQPQLYTEVVPVRAEQIARLQDDLAKARDENKLLREQKDNLEIRLESLLEGQDTYHGGQIVHLANNPLSQCAAEKAILIEQLQQENIKLKSKLKKMEEGAETSAVGDISICPKEVQALKEQIKNNEKQSQRLKDYFKSSMQDFRNVIYMLFGYKIDKPSNSSIYKLRSMYALRAEDQLCFEVNPEGDLNLLENEFSANLGPMIDLHLIHQNSIPVFLSAITMDLFNQKTMTKAF
ncbi:hypothetical protein GWI33_009097 [Rhynchophorus ferrugineus]|uniref:Mitotic spindle assembly checkpoint protein MAD1 n=1 Tax=Rhynchophorus ferrugineus TaxID=354439 RepID=A0A834IH07_RHYFE|nr:hypothetical protein GWI33_009097 [Rhynchophorus ferrugineus]